MDRSSNFVSDDFAICYSGRENQQRYKDGNYNKKHIKKAVTQ